MPVQLTAKGRTVRIRDGIGAKAKMLEVAQYKVTSFENLEPETFLSDVDVEVVVPGSKREKEILAGPPAKAKPAPKPDATPVAKPAEAPASNGRNGNRSRRNGG